MTLRNVEVQRGTALDKEGKTKAYKNGHSHLQIEIGEQFLLFRILQNADKYANILLPCLEQFLHARW